MGQNVPHLLEVAVCNHAVSFIKNEHVHKRQAFKQISVNLVIHQLP